MKDFFNEEFSRLEQAGFEKTITDFESKIQVSFFNKKTKFHLFFEVFPNGSFTANCWLPDAYAPNRMVRAGVKIAKETLQNIVDDTLQGYGFYPESVLPSKRLKEDKLFLQKLEIGI